MNKIALLVVIALLVGCAPVVPIKESPATVPAPSAPAVQPPSTAPAPSTSPSSTDTCESNCMTQCAEDGEKACAQATDYDVCVASCGPYNKDGSCKGGCATGTPIECAIIMKSGCKKDCPKICAESS
jgi:hypothetical protein